MARVSQVEVRNSYILINIQGEAFRPLDVSLAIQKARRAVKEHNIQSILVMRSHPVKMLSSLLYLTKLAEYLGGQDIKAIRVALVFPLVMHTQELKIFVDAVQSIGVDMGLFGEVPEAEKWLENPHLQPQIQPKQPRM